MRQHAKRVCCCKREFIGSSELPTRSGVGSLQRGSYGHAIGLVRRAREAGRFQSDQRAPRGCVLTTIHRSRARNSTECCSLRLHIRVASSGTATPKHSVRQHASCYVWVSHGCGIKWRSSDRRALPRLYLQKQQPYRARRGLCCVSRAGALLRYCKHAWNLHQARCTMECLCRRVQPIVSGRMKPSGPETGESVLVRGR